MVSPSALLGDVLSIWLAALLAIIAYRCLTGRISIAGLFQGADGRFSPGRVQLLASTLGVLGTFVLTVLDKHSMSDVPDSLLVVMLASHGAYLAGKHLARNRFT